MCKSDFIPNAVPPMSDVAKERLDRSNNRLSQPATCSMVAQKLTRVGLAVGLQYICSAANCEYCSTIVPLVLEGFGTDSST